MIIDKIFEEFIVEVMDEQRPYATEEEIRKVVEDMLIIIKSNKDATPEEWIELIIADNIKQLEDIKNKYPIPGYNVMLRVANINVHMFGGSMSYNGETMTEDALFDIASMTKFYTQIVAYNLIKEGMFKMSDKIGDLDPRFSNLKELTVKDILTFTTKFKTDGRIDDKITVDEALKCLYGATVEEVGTYNYNDIGMMIVKELMENITGKSYSDLVDEYIVNKLGLSDTHLYVPESKIIRLTGSPNTLLGAVNDQKSIAVGGFSGHAGIFASSKDVIELGSKLNEVISEEMLKDAYTRGVSENRGIMGNTYVSHEKGIDKSFVDRLEARKNFAIQGSTRVQANFGKYSNSVIFFNPSSMSIERALEEEKRINFERTAKGLNEVKLVKNFAYNRDGKLTEYKLIDARQMAPASKTVEPVTTKNAELALRLEFLNKVLQEYGYSKDIDINKNIK